MTQHHNYYSGMSGARMRLSAADAGYCIDVEVTAQSEVEIKYVCQEMMGDQDQACKSIVSHWGTRLLVTVLCYAIVIILGHDPKTISLELMVVFPHTS